MIIKKLKFGMMFVMVGVFGIVLLLEREVLASGKTFILEETYLWAPTPQKSEYGARARQNENWNFELSNKNNYRIFFSLESFFPRYEPLVNKREVGPGQKIRFAFGLNEQLYGNYIIKVWTHDILHTEPDIVKVLVVMKQTAFLSVDGTELRPQKGILGSTQSGLSLRYNITERAFYSEKALERDKDFNMEWKRATEEKAAVAEFKKQRHGIMEESTSESDESSSSEM